MLLVCLLMAVALTACGSSSVSPEEKDDAGGKSSVMAGILVGTSAHERWQKEIAMFEEYATELGVKVLIQTAEDDQSKQLSQCENMLSQGIDVLICQPVDSQGTGTIVNVCHEEGIKVMAYDRFIENSELDYSVGFDGIQVGEL